MQNIENFYEQFQVKKKTKKEGFFTKKIEKNNRWSLRHLKVDQQTSVLNKDPFTVKVDCKM